MPGDDRLILLTGATGYAGGRLLKALEAAGRPLRCLARRPEHLRPRAAPATEVVRGDVSDADSLRTTLAGVDTAYYLVYSMGANADFAARDRRAAETFARAAAEAGTRRIVYLGGVRFGSRIVDSRSVRVPCPPRQAFAAVRRIGGETGWHYADWLWRLRGLLDLVAGGAGLRRGRRDPGHLLPGDTVDFWRVEDVEPDRMLRLYAEMKLPGRAWLQFEVEPDGDGAVIRQTPIFDPVGLPGLVYWYGLYPIHLLVFAGMLKGIARAARRTHPRGRVAA